MSLFIRQEVTIEDFDSDNEERVTRIGWCHATDASDHNHAREVIKQRHEIASRDPRNQNTGRYAIYEPTEDTEDDKCPDGYRLIEVVKASVPDTPTVSLRKVSK